MKSGSIDIGTNSVRYLVVESQPSGAPTIIARGLVAPRLGEGLARAGVLSDAAIDRTVRELSHIKNKLNSLGVSEFRCVGTEALRRAGNSDVFIRRAAGIGLKITILTGEREARLIYNGAINSINIPAEEKILVDVGGGSTEIITTRGEEEPHFISLPLGCVRLEELYVRKRPDLMKKHCRDILQKKLGSDPDFSTLIGLGGTFTTLAAISLRMRVYDGEQVHGLSLTGDNIERIREMLARCAPEEMKKVPGLEPSRSDIIIPGIIIVRVIMDHFGCDKVIISDRGLLWGLIPKCSGP